MTETERKALALLQECGWGGAHLKRTWNPRYEALCRAIEQHEAFAQEVSDAVEKYWGYMPCEFKRFVIAKPGPLLEILREEYGDVSADADAFRQALAARGLKITNI